MAKDFVCGMELDEKKAGASYDFEGNTYYFCASACKDRFVDSPEQYIRK
jgi:YHS domain-containing protein